MIDGCVREENNAEFAENKSDIADDITDEPKSNRAEIKFNRAEIKSNRAETERLCAIKLCEIVIDFHEYAFLVCRHGFNIFPQAFLICFHGVCGAAGGLGMYEGSFLLLGDKKNLRPALLSEGRRGFRHACSNLNFAYV